MKLTGLNEEQRLAVEHRGSPLLVLAGAGSGKTRVITTRIAHLLHTKDAKPSDILAVTFTNRAAKEMKERVGSLVGEKRGQELSVSTFHSFCATLLRKEIEPLGFTKRFTIYDASDQRTLMGRVFHDFSQGADKFDIGAFCYRISLAKNRGETPETYQAERHDKYDERVPAIWEAYQEALAARDALDFDDLLMKTLELLDNHPEVLGKLRKKYRHILIDEYQDTNLIQFRIAKSLAEEHRNLCVVGDDDQSIYAWRGADVANILEFQRHFPDARVITLDRNYRSTGTIIKASNEVISRNTKRMVKVLRSQGGEGQPIDLVGTQDEVDEANYVADQIKELRVHYNLEWSDFGVLYRSNVQSRTFEMIFRQRQIPYVVVGGMDYFARKEIKDIASYLRVLNNSKDEVSLRRIINVPKRGIGDNSLMKLNESARISGLPLYQMLNPKTRPTLPDAAHKGIEEFLELLRKTRARIREQGIAPAVLGLIEESGYLEELEKTSASPKAFEIKKEMVLDLANAAAAYERTESSPSLLGFLQNASLDTDYQSGKDEKRYSDNCVRLMTLHSAKGLEFPVVFLAGVEEGILPHARAAVLDNEVHEERRLMYVGMTRAKKHLIITTAAIRTQRGRSKATRESRFLDEIPEEFLRLLTSEQPVSTLFAAETI
ncbi:MAG: UvrD-helicase domain-containing protein [Candidatus Omnitrophica bacterium]|nr:UvrD-helicase domain-containing protein [Candidatus Omnitrophota bacterium]